MYMYYVEAQHGMPKQHLALDSNLGIRIPGLIVFYMVQRLEQEWNKTAYHIHGIFAVIYYFILFYFLFIRYGLYFCTHITVKKRM